MFIVASWPIVSSGVQTDISPVTIRYPRKSVGSVSSVVYGPLPKSETSERIDHR